MTASPRLMLHPSRRPTPHSPQSSRRTAMRSSTSRHIFWALLLVAFVCSGPALAQAPKGWVQGKGYGWIWGPNDEIGSLNTLTPAKVMEALKIPTQGKVYDLGVLYDRAPFQWPGHSPAAGI